MATNAIAIKEQADIQRHPEAMPAMSMEMVIARRNLMVEFVKSAMVRGVDYGCIPSTDKPTLLKPGAEKLCTLFRLSPRFQVVEKETDWTGAEHNGEMFFYYNYRCQLFNGDLLIAEGEGSCNSFEKKYRWRKCERVCPSCGIAAIFKSKDNKGWYCWVKKEGCGAKFNNGEASIEQQEVGRVPNPDMADSVNTIQKMGQKRALIAATLLAVNASEFFTQDIEDQVIEAEIVHEQPQQQFANGRLNNDPQAPTQKVAPATPTRKEKLIDRIEQLYTQEAQLGGKTPAGECFEPLSDKSEEELVSLGKQIAARVEGLKNKPVAAPEPPAQTPAMSQPAGAQFFEPEVLDAEPVAEKLQPSTDAKQKAISRTYDLWEQEIALNGRKPKEEVTFNFDSATIEEIEALNAKITKRNADRMMKKG